MNKKSFRILSSLAIAIATVTSGAYAAELEEVIVTAQKRAESLQEVPVSLTAISGTKIEEAGLHSFAEMSAYVPNLTITENAVNTIIAMRGIGVGANQSFEQSVGVYVDGIHYGKSRQSRTALFDVQQVEVLRGPQGILFGKNTLAGAINVTTATPDADEEFGGKISGSKESFGGTTLEGHLTGSIADTIGLRLAFKDRSNDGEFKNTYAGALTKSMPTVDESMWRASATWEPTDSTRVEIKHSESDNVRLGQNSITTVFNPVSNLGAASGLMFGVVGLVRPEFAGIVASGNRTPYRDSQAIGGCALEANMGMSSAYCVAGGERPEGTDTATADTSLSFEMELDNGYTLTAVAGRGRYEYQDGLDADWLPLEFIGRSDISEYDHTSQEFRLTSPTEGRFSWVGGVYLDQQDQEIDRTVVIDGTFGLPEMLMKTILGGGNPALGLDTILALNPAQVGGINATTPVPGTGLTLQGLYDATGCAVGAASCLDYTLKVGVEGSTKFHQAGRLSNWTQDTNSRAVFFQGTYDLTDSVAITAGARYTEEEKRSYALMELTTNTTGLGVPNTNGVLAAIVDGFGLGVAHEFNESRSSNQFLPAANIEWTRSEDSMFYLSYSEGFKSGGFNSVDDQLPAFTAEGVQPNVPGPGFEYDDENADSIEIGGKHTLLDGGMTLNWALYDSTYENQQVSTFVGTGFVVTNAATTEIQGLEVDLQWQATDHLKLGASFALSDGKFGSYPGAGCTVQQQSGILGLAREAGREVLYASDPVTSFDGCQANFRGDGVQSGASVDRTGEKVGVDYNGTLSADYARPVMGGLLWMTSIDVNFIDGYQMIGGSTDPATYQDAFSKTNFRTGLKGENWAVMLYGKNVFDEKTASGAFPIPLASGAFAEYTTPGSVWGATLNYSF
ncbi:TonB-dependent receptor [Porticoccaceae bacterium]|nr:TonB-dependent receptor [Porticoccaceae bacterium]MDB2621244.1 TonB-dependent receptor [Porticoccaceae bacterium]